MLACGNPHQMGYVEYRCLHCGQGKHLVSMSCKSSLCLRCAKVYVDNWVSQVSHMLHEGVLYRHIILTVPAMFNTAQCCSTRGSRRYRRHAQHDMTAITPATPGLNAPPSSPWEDGNPLTPGATCPLAGHCQVVAPAA